MTSILVLLAALVLLAGSAISPIGTVRANTGCPGSTNAFGTQSVSGDCTITSNTVWGNGTLTIAGSLYVNGGVTLTLWNLVVKFSQTADLQHVLSVGGTLVVRWGGLQSNDAYHWSLSSSGRVDLQHTNVSTAGVGATAGLGIFGAANNVVAYSRLSGLRVSMLGDRNDYFGYNNLSNYDDSATGNNQVFTIGSNSTVEHNSFWNVTAGTQAIIFIFQNWGNVKIFANDIKYRANGNNAMGIEVRHMSSNFGPVNPSGYLVRETWNNLTLTYRSGGTNDIPFDNEYSERIYIANNTVSGVTDGCLQGGGLVNSLMENNVCKGAGIGGSFGIYDYIYDTAFTVFRNNHFDNYANGLEFQTGNVTVTGNAFTNLTEHGIWECSSAPCAGSATATTHNLYAGNTFSWKPGYGPVGNMTRMYTTNYVANVFIGHTPTSNAPSRYYLADTNSFRQFNGDWLYWGNAAFQNLQWSNNTNGSRCLTATLPSLTAVDCKPLGTALSNSLSVAGPIDQHGSVDLSNNPRQVTVLYKLGRDRSSLSLRTSNSGRFTFSLTGQYYGTYRVNMYNYSGVRWENLTTLYTTMSGNAAFARSMSGFYNISFVLVNITAGGPPPPSAPPIVATGAATAIALTAATLNGQVTSLGTAASVSAGFLWGTSPGLTGATNVTSPQSPLTSPAAFSNPLSGLAAGTRYYFQAWANGEGFATGGIQTFTTGATPVPPSVSTGVASFVGPTSATLNGNLGSLGSAPSVAVGFLYGPNAGLSGATNVSSGSESSPGSFSTALQGLSPGTTYYFRAWASGNGFATGSVLSFAASNPGTNPPVATTMPATAVGASSATINGNVSSLGSAVGVNVGFLYGTSSTLTGALNVTVGVASAPQVFSLSLTGLAARQAYYYEAWATGQGFATGGIQSFTTATSSPPVAPAVLAVTFSPDRQQLDVQFSQPMDRASVAGAVSIRPSAAFEMMWPNDSHLQVRLESSPSADTVYNLSIGATARNSDGLALGDPFTFQFTVTPAATGTPANPMSGFVSSLLPWISLGLAGACVAIFALYRRSRKKVLALRQSARLLARRIQELRAATPNPAPEASSTSSLRPVPRVRRPVPEPRTP